MTPARKNRWIEMLIPILFGIASGVVMGAITYLRVQADMVATVARLQADNIIIERRISEDRADIDKLMLVGPSGMVEPLVHTAIDTHLNHWAESVFGRSGWRKLVDQYSTDGHAGD